MLPWEKEAQTTNSKLPWEEDQLEVSNKKQTDFQAWGIQPSPQKDAQYDILRRKGLLSQETMNLSYKEAYQLVNGINKQIPSQGVEGYLTRDVDPPQQAMSPVLKQGMRDEASKDMTTSVDTTGMPSALLSGAKWGLDKLNSLNEYILKQPAPILKQVARALPNGKEIEKQMLSKPEDRRGIPGVVASTVLPRVYTTPTAEVAQNPLMTLFQTLNLFGAAVSSAAETTSESIGIGTPPKGLENAGWLEREAANYSRAASGVEGFAELGEKAGKVLDKKYPGGSRVGTGIVSLGSSEAGKFILDKSLPVFGPVLDILIPGISKKISETSRPSADDVGWLIGLGVDVLIPSTGEVGSIASKVMKVFKPLPPAKGIQVVSNSTIVDNAEWNVAREIDLNKTDGGLPLKDPTQGYSSGKTRIIENNIPLKADMFNGVDSVVQVPRDTKFGTDDIIGVEFRMVDGVPTPTRSLIRVENTDGLKARLDKLESDLKEPKGAAPILVARNDIRTARNIAQKIDDLTKDVSGLKNETPTVPPTSGARKAAYRKLIQAKEETYFNERLSSIPERWKYWAKKKDIDGAFNDLFEFKDIKKINSDPAKSELKQQLDLFEPGGSKKIELNINDLIPAEIRQNLVANILSELDNAGVKINTGIDVTTNDPGIKNIIEIEYELREAIDNLLLNIWKDDAKILDDNKKIFENKKPVERLRKAFELISDNLSKGTLELGEKGKVWGSSNKKYKIDKNEELMKLDFDTLMAKTYIGSSKEKIAQEMIKRLSDIGISHIHTVLIKDNISKLPPIYSDVSSALQETITKVLARELSLEPGLRKDTGDILSEIIKEMVGLGPTKNRVMPDKYTYEMVWNDFLNTPAIIDPLSAFAQTADAVAFSTATKLLLSDKTGREQLARIINTIPELKINFGKKADELVNRRSIALSEQIVEKLWKAGPDANPWIRLLNLFVTRHSTFLKSSILGGVFFPNFRYLTMNFLTAPPIIYQQLGAKSAIGAIANFHEATSVMADIKGHSINRARPLIRVPTEVEGKYNTYTVGDIANIITEYNLTGGTSRFELTSSVMEDIMNNIPNELKKTPWMEIIPEMITRQLGVSGSPNMFNQFASDIDTTWRTSVLIDSLRSGDNIDVAVRKARESLFNYNALTSFEKNYVAHNFFFYSFMRHNFTSAFRNLMTGKGQTRIRNSLMPLYKPEDDDNKYAEYGSTRIKIPSSIMPPGYELYGPAIPIADALKQISDITAMAYFINKLQPATAADIGLDTVAQVGVNPYLEEFVSLLSGGKWDLRNRRNQGEGPDQRIVAVWKAFGLLKPDGSGTAAELFQLTPDTNERYTGSKLDPMKANNYRFGNDAGRANYAAWQRLFSDVILGLSRTPRDIAYLVDPRLNWGVAVSTYTGFTTPISEKTLIKIDSENKARVQERYKNK